MKDLIRKSFIEAGKVLNEFLTAENIALIEQVANLVAAAFRDKKKVIICGNGGSNCDAMHFAEEFTGRFRKDRPPLPVIALSDSSHITCVANDYGYEHVFARAVEAYAVSGDVFIGISTSGDSENVYRAANKAQLMKLHTIGLLGKNGGVIKDVCSHSIIVKAFTTDRIQEMHIKILHIIIEMVERTLFSENYED